MDIPDKILSGNLSYSARGLLITAFYLFGKDGFNKNSFLNDSCGKSKIDRIFKELKEKEYIKITTERGYRGRIANRYWTITL
jgi:hypothetical protein